MANKIHKLTKTEREEIKNHPWIHKGKDYVPPPRPIFYDWDQDIARIDEPLIRPEEIPLGYEQSWDLKSQTYALRKKQNPRAKIGIRKIQTDDYIQFCISDNVYYVIDLRAPKNPPVQEVT